MNVSSLKRSEAQMRYRRRQRELLEAALGNGCPVTPREHEILLLIADGHKQEEIAERLQIEYKTVRNHLTHIYDRLETPNAVATVALGLRQGWLK